MTKPVQEKSVRGSDSRILSLEAKTERDGTITFSYDWAEVVLQDDGTYRNVKTGEIYTDP